MESSADAIKIAVATIITAVVITIVLFISGMLNTSTNKAADSAITTVNEVVNYDITKYDGQTISGEEVRHLIEKLYDQNVFIRVITKANRSGFTNQIAVGSYNLHAFDDIYYRDSDKFINGEGSFKVTLGYDANDVFYGIIFKQV